MTENISIVDGGGLFYVILVTVYFDGLLVFVSTSVGMHTNIQMLWLCFVKGIV